MPIIFEATEAGFWDGLGGAPNISSGSADYHYVVFGRQEDKQEPNNSGVYFEYDDQLHGDVNTVAKILIVGREVTFYLADESIVVRVNLEERLWDEFVKGLDETFGPDMVNRE